MSWGLMYFFVPLILNKPIWSHSLSVIGFWALASVYPLGGVHHFLISPIPDDFEFGAIASTIAIEVVMTTVVVNFFMTLRGRDVSLGFACRHCHRQYVRTVSNEHVRWWPPSSAQKCQNALNQPHLWGTRRVGLDLARERGKQTNDWHIAHFIDPKSFVPHSVMPACPFYFDDKGVPKVYGIELVTHLQWLGTMQVGIPVAERVTP